MDAHRKEMHVIPSPREKAQLRATRARERLVEHCCTCALGCTHHERHVTTTDEFFGELDVIEPVFTVINQCREGCRLAIAAGQAAMLARDMDKQVEA